MMRLSRYILVLMLFAALSCNKEEKSRLEQLQQELSALEQKDSPEVSDAVQPASSGDTEYAFVLDKERYGVDAGSSVTIHYTLPTASSVEVMVKGGWSATVNATSATEGDIVVSAPDPASPVELVATATSEGGLATAMTLPLMVRDPYSTATRPRMEAIGYYCFKPWNATLENYQKLADAGLTMVTLETDEGDWQSYIDLAAQAGLKTLAIVLNHAGYWYDNMEYTGLDELINYLKDCPDVYGYHMCDEPSVDDIWRLMAIKDKIRQLDDTRPIYINLLANASPAGLGVSTYPEYVNIMADYLDFDFISFDIYPVLVGAIQPGWHMCLETVSDAAKRRGIPFWAFAASCWINKESTTLKREKPNAYNIQLQIYTDLAYGAQAVQYFTIQDYGGTDYAPIMRDGTWTQAYEELKKANLTMQKRAFVFKDCNVTKVRQLGMSASHEDALSILDLPQEIKSIDVTFSATVSFIENNGNEYMVIVNNYWSADEVVKVELDSPVYYIDSEGQFNLLESGINNVWLSKGEMVVLKYK